SPPGSSPALRRRPAPDRCQRPAAPGAAGGVRDTLRPALRPRRAREPAGDGLERVDRPDRRGLAGPGRRRPGVALNGAGIRGRPRPRFGPGRRERSAMSRQVDLFVIGGGSGGVRAARIAAGHGARVMVAEEFRYGGTCVIRGCVPKKLLVIASRFADLFEEARGFGWKIGSTEFDWARLRTAKEGEITRLEGIYRRNLVSAGVQALDSRAVREGPNRVRLLATGETIEAAHILVATGGTPFRPPIEGAELAITSNEVFDLEVLPETMLIEGGGFIALEFACLLQRLGVQVTVTYRGEQILRGFDDDVRNQVCDAVRAAGIEVLVRTEVQSIRREDGQLLASLSDGSSRRVGQLMFATGRTPATAGIGLEEAGVRLGRRGAIEVGPD